MGDHGWQLGEMDPLLTRTRTRTRTRTLTLTLTLTLTQGGASRPATRGSRRPRGAPWSPPKVRVTCEASPGAERGVSVRLAL